MKRAAEPFSEENGRQFRERTPRTQEDQRNDVNSNPQKFLQEEVLFLAKDSWISGHGTINTHELSDNAILAENCGNPKFLEYNNWASLVERRPLDDSLNVVTRSRRVKEASIDELRLPLLSVIILYPSDGRAPNFTPLAVQPFSNYSTLKALLCQILHFYKEVDNIDLNSEDVMLCSKNSDPEGATFIIYQTCSDKSLKDIRLDTEAAVYLQIKEKGTNLWPARPGNLHNTIHEFVRQDERAIYTATGHGRFPPHQYDTLPPPSVFELVLSSTRPTRSTSISIVPNISHELVPLPTSHTVPSQGFNSDSTVSPSPLVEVLPEDTVESVVSHALRTRGVVGLNNLGNTCFMNSAIQCLSNTEPLTRFFCSEDWKHDLNPTNPLGMKGEIASEYASLIRELWKNVDPNESQSKWSFYSKDSVYPRELKMAVAKFNNTFQGYHQHDSQELLTFLLDGIHEDLNRIIKKPYVEMPDMKGYPDEQVAEKTWSNHKLRNDSVIVDNFQGQYKSKVTCSVCNEVGLTFDPFMYLTVPVPDRKRVVRKFIAVPLNGMPKKCSVDVPRSAQMVVAQKAIADSMGWNQDNVMDRSPTPSGRRAAKMFCLETWHCRPYKILEEHESVAPTQPADELWAWELENPQDVVEKLAGLSEPCPITETMVESEYWAGIQEETVELLKSDLKRGATMEVFPIPVFIESDSDQKTKPSPFKPPVIISLPQRIWVKIQVWETMSENDLEDVGLNAVAKVIFAEVVNHLKRFLRSTNGLEDDLEIWLRRLVSGYSKPDHNDPWPLRDFTTRKKANFRNWSERNPRTNYGLYSREKLKMPEDAMPFEMDFCVEFEKSDLLSAIFDAQALANYFDEVSIEPGLNGTFSPSEMTSSTVVNPQQTSFNETLDLYRCLHEFAKEEELENDDAWYCPNCKTHQKSHKKMDVWSAPDILIVHLKRFSSSGARWSNADKVDTLVEFPIHGLDLNPFVLHNAKTPGDLIYDLYAVSNHFGGTGGGHYTAYAKNFLDNCWYTFDDSRVSPMKEDEVVSSSAYLLFYRRRSSIQPPQELPQIEHVKEDTLVRDQTPSGPLGTLSLKDKMTIADARVNRFQPSPSNTPNASRTATPPMDVGEENDQLMNDALPNNLDYSPIPPDDLLLSTRQTDPNDTVDELMD